MDAASRLQQRSCGGIGHVIGNPHADGRGILVTHTEFAGRGEGSLFTRHQHGRPQSRRSQGRRNCNDDRDPNHGAEVRCASLSTSGLARLGAFRRMSQFEVLVEQEIVAPVRVILKLVRSPGGRAAGHGHPARRCCPADARSPWRHAPPGARGTPPQPCRRTASLPMPR